MKRSRYLERESRSKATLTFNFDTEVVKAAGLTTDELLENMRAYARDCGYRWKH